MRNLFLIGAIFLALTSAVNSCSPSDREALLSFRRALKEHYLGIFSSWTGSDCCKWYGVTCDPSEKRVGQITLRGVSEEPIFRGRTGYMSGTISPAICKLDRLSGITLSDWRGISGPIPHCIVGLKSLRHLDLVGNKLSGHLPVDIGKLSRLVMLNVAENQISGTIPGSITHLSYLMHLDLRNNEFSGPIPRKFGNLGMLSRALLSHNRLTGQIPVSISTIYRLVDLDLSFNEISGTIPAWLGKRAVLAMLNLDGNRLTGPIPPTLLSSSITSLNLSYNGLSGPIPDTFGPRSYFTVLDLSHNNLKGRIPKSVSSASYIGHLDMSYNHLCGPIPSGPPFDHLEASLFLYNDCLCGKPLRPCKK